MRSLILGVLALAAAVGGACAAPEASPVPASTPTARPTPTTTSPAVPLPTATPPLIRIPTPTPGRPFLPRITPTPSPRPGDTPTPLATPTPAPSLASAAGALRPVLVRVTAGTETATGVVIDPDGYVLTEASTVRGVSSATVRLADGREMEARIVGRDEVRDLAVLKLEAAGLESVVWGDPDRLSLGERLFALGYAEELPDELTAAVGTLGRIHTGDEAGAVFLLTDVLRVRGHAGGPLVSIDGEVFGINVWNIPPITGAARRGASVSVSVASLPDLVPKLMAGQRVLLPPATPTPTPRPRATRGPRPTPNPSSGPVPTATPTIAEPLSTPTPTLVESQEVV